MATPLLQTKLYIPPPRPEWVPRPRLIERLNAGLHRKLALISAPAGFGKTTLISEWIVDLARPCSGRAAWLSLDEHDNDPTRFLTYLIAALQAALRSAEQPPETGIGKGALSALGTSVLESPQPPPIEAILIALVNASARMVLVLDDYHLITAQPVHDALTFLLDHLPQPPLGGIHTVIATRGDPPLPLARLRAQGQLTELRSADLRFSPSEAADFFNQAMGLDLSSQEVAALERRTEGWIVGLQLAALALQTPAKQAPADTAHFIQAFAGSHHYVLDYLVQEVLQRQPERVRDFLLQTSILARLCGPLCDAVQSGGARPAGQGGRRMLRALERGNLFVVPLDDRRRWYRYHHLFADVLRVHLMEEQSELVPALHRRASEWYEQNRLLAEAIRHAVAAGDFGRAADLAELAWPAWSGSYQSIAWLGWLKALPDKLVRARPVLCVAYAWAHLNAGQLEAAESRLQDAEGWLEPDTDTGGRPDATANKTRPEQPALSADGFRLLHLCRPSKESRRMVVVDEEQFRSLPASLAAARAYHAQAIGDLSSTVRYARRVLDLLPEGYPKWRGDATALLGLAQWASGNLEAAHRTFADGLAGMKPLAVIVGTFVLADIQATLGRLHEAARTCERALQLAAEQGEPAPIGTEDVYTEISKLHREWGDLEAAASDLATAKRLGDQVELPDWQYRWCIAQARLQETLGDLDGALDLLDEAGRVHVRTPLPDVRPIAALKARIWVAQGRLAEALSWAREQGLSADDDLCYLREFEHITLARVLVAQYKRGREERSIHDAMGLIERLLEEAEEGGQTGSAIELLVLQALAHEAQGDVPSALVSLERALTLAEPQGYLQIFVDQGPPMAALLREAANLGIAPNYVRRLRAAFEKTAAARAGAGKRPVTQPLIEPLSERELDVLRLLGTDLSGPEIARELVVSLNTMRTHTKNIYGKLGVHSRRAAVRRSEELGLL